MEKKSAVIVNNTTMLYILTIAKMVFPLITLPYLTRTLSTDVYGVVSYVKSCMSYAQIIIDFGFLLSAVKDITKVKDNRDEVNKIIGNTYFAKTILVGIALIVMAILIFSIPLLRANWLYAFLSFVAVAASAYLADFLFRGIEKMGFITLTYVVMKGISTVLTLVFVDSDERILLIPLFDIFSTLLADGISWFIFVKMGYKPVFSGWKAAWKALKESAVFFASNMATTALSALNTVLIGIFITDTTQIAYWGVCMQLVSAVQALYNPLINGIYPAMVRDKSKKLLLRMTYIFMPVVAAGCVFCFFAARWILVLISGESYAAAATVFQSLIPVLFFSYPSMLYGWPALGAIGREKETTATTILTALFQCAGLAILILCGQFTLINIALLRGATELVLLLSRLFFCIKYRKEFR